MRAFSVSTILSLVLLLLPVCGAFPSSDLPRYTVNLDDEPEDRWASVFGKNDTLRASLSAGIKHLAEEYTATPQWENVTMSLVKKVV